MKATKPRIAPFFETVSFDALASDVLNPGVYAPVRVTPKKSIAQTLQALRDCEGQSIDIFDRRKKPVADVKVSHVAARVLYSMSLGLIVAPAGGLYHGVQSLKAIVQRNWSLMRQHVAASVSDFTYFAIHAAGLIPAFYASFDPEFPLNFYPQDVRLQAAKSCAMRREFGLITTDGKLLPYDRQEDDEDIKNTGFLASMWKEETNKILFLVQALQKALPNTEKLAYTDKTDGHMLATKLRQKSCHQEVQKYATNFEALQNRIDIIKKILQRCISIKYDRVTPFSGKFYKLPQAVFNEEYVKPFYQQTS